MTIRRNSWIICCDSRISNIYQNVISVEICLHDEMILDRMICSKITPFKNIAGPEAPPVVSVVSESLPWAQVGSGVRQDPPLKWIIFVITPAMLCASKAFENVITFHRDSDRLWRLEGQVLQRTSLPSLQRKDIFVRARLLHCPGINPRTWPEDPGT